MESVRLLRRSGRLKVNWRTSPSRARVSPGGISGYGFTVSPQRRSVELKNRELLGMWWPHPALAGAGPRRIRGMARGRLHGPASSSRHADSPPRHRDLRPVDLLLQCTYE